jgi:hypothetical protein
MRCLVQLGSLDFADGSTCQQAGDDLQAAISMIRAGLFVVLLVRGWHAPVLSRCLEQALPGSALGNPPGLRSIGMWWLDDIIVPAVLILGVSCFVLLVRSSTRRSVRKTTTRTAEDLYPLYADSIRKQRKYAKEHGGQWRDDEGSRRPRLSGQQRGRPTPIPAQARSGHALNDLLHGRERAIPPACWQPEGISIRFPHDLHSNSTCLAPTAIRGCLRI